MSIQRVAVGHDIVALLIKGLGLLGPADIDPKQRDAIITMLWNTDMMTLEIGHKPSFSLAARAK